jgi:uncharacterized LabA/DUF88 family protein
MREPAHKRVIAFIDGQNLFHSVRWEYGYTFPNYDVVALARAVVAGKVANGWSAPAVRFYTGLPDGRDARWNKFWQRKLAFMGRQGVTVFTRHLRYRRQTFECPTCKTQHTRETAEEKGVDVRIALDVLTLASRDAFDVGLIFSQDQDLSEAADEVRVIARQTGRWIKLASAYAHGTRNPRGINGTDWLPFSRPLYDACIDRRDYRAP